MLKDDLLIVHHTKSAGASFTAQQILKKHNIFFIKALDESCTILKVKAKDLSLAKQLLNKM